MGIKPRPSANKRVAVIYYPDKIARRKLTAAIETEILKCDLLCANCHAEAHYPHLSLLAMEIG